MKLSTDEIRESIQGRSSVYSKLGGYSNPHVILVLGECLDEIDRLNAVLKERDQMEADTIAYVRNTMQADFDSLLDKLQDGEGSLRERVRRLEALVDRLSVALNM